MFGFLWHFCIAVVLAAPFEPQNDTAFCARFFKDPSLERKSSRWLWKQADSIGFGYPKYLQRYIRLLALSLTDSLNLEPDDPYMDPYGWQPTRRFCGLAWTVKRGFTIVGLMRLRNIAQLLLAVMSNSIEGDYVEAGVWRGGTGIFAKGIIDEMAEMDTSKAPRSVHLFDAFDLGVQHYDGWLKNTFNKVKPQQVRSWFRMFGMGYEGVHLYKGYFKDTVPAFYHKRKGTSFKIAVLRLDANFIDAYQDCLYYFYEFVPVGGYVIFDDYYLADDMQIAWLEFKTDFEITEEIVSIDGVAAYFKKMKEVKVDFSKMRAPRDANIELKKMALGRHWIFKCFFSLQGGVHTQPCFACFSAHPKSSKAPSGASPLHWMPH